MSGYVVGGVGAFCAFCVCPSSADNRPVGAGLRSPAGEHGGILTDFQTKVKEKAGKNSLFLVIN
jgi:hypothetical protein